jgi:hypothetical protein
VIKKTLVEEDAMKLVKLLIFFFQWALYKNRIMAFVWPKPESYRTHFCDLAFRKMGVRK